MDKKKAAKVSKKKRFGPAAALPDRLRSTYVSGQKPVLWRVMIPLTAVLLLLIAGFFVILLRQHQTLLESVISGEIATIGRELPNALNEQAKALGMLIEVIARNSDMKKALAAGDAGWLLAAYRPLFEKFRRDFGVTHLYFHDADRVNLLRVHKPEKHGDLINRYTARKAERTGKVCRGIELGPLGTFTLRVVKPVIDTGKRIGYVEMGTEIEEILKNLHDAPGVELAVIINKTALDRKRWEAGMRMLGRSADWARFADDALIYNSIPKFPELLDGFIKEKNHVHLGRRLEAEFMDRFWRVAFIPLSDASASVVGDLIVMRDVTREKTCFLRFLVSSGVVCLTALALLLGFFFILLTRTDRGIRAREQSLLEIKKELQESEEKFRTISASAQDAIIMMDHHGKISYWNKAAQIIFGYDSRAALGGDLHTLLSPERFRQSHADAFPRFQQTGRGDAVGRTLELTALKKRGVELPIELSLSAVQIKGRWHAIGIIRDITERKQIEREHREREKLEGVMEMAGAVSHELNQPLQVVSGYSELLLMDIEPDDPKHEILTAILAGIERIGELTGKLMKITEYRTKDYMGGNTRIIDIERASGHRRREKPGRHPIKANK